MTTEDIIDEALRLDAEYRESLSHNAARYHSARDQFLAHAADYYAAMCRRVRELEAEVERLRNRLANSGANDR